MGRFRSVKTVETLLRDAFSEGKDLELSFGFLSMETGGDEVRKS
jgi:hypothetical protein